jgi:hypothetical protein
MTLHHWPNPRVPWRSFHNHWAIRLVEYLNQGVLPVGFRARPTEFIIGVEPDVLLLQEHDRPDMLASTQTALAEATLTAVLPAPAELPIVGVYSAYDATRLVAVIELVSPGNKDRSEAIQAFVEKVVFLLQDGVHVMVIDVLSLPQLSIRRPILGRLGLDTETAAEGSLWISSYCSLPGGEPYPHVEVREWAQPAAIGKPLPATPLFLRGDKLWVTVDLETTYQATLRAGRYEPT